MARQRLCAGIDGFSLHAAVRVEAHERMRLQQLRRSITRPALSGEPVQINAAVQQDLTPPGPVFNSPRGDDNKQHRRHEQQC